MASCSRDHVLPGAAPAPMPNSNRPLLIAWTLAADVASTPGCRFATLATIEPRPMDVVDAASAPSSVKHSSIRSPCSTLPDRWSNTHTAPTPAASAATAVSRNCAQSVVAAFSSRSRITHVLSLSCASSTHPTTASRILKWRSSAPGCNRRTSTAGEPKRSGPHWRRTTASRCTLRPTGASRRSRPCTTPDSCGSWRRDGPSTRRRSARPAK